MERENGLELTSRLLRLIIFIMYYDEELKKWVPFGTSPVSDTYWVFIDEEIYKQQCSDTELLINILRTSWPYEKI